MNGKGFYIALALCLVAIGSAAYIAVNKSAGLLSQNPASSKPSVVSGTAGNYNWNGTDSTQQTGNVVSGITDTRSSSSRAGSNPASGKTSSAQSGSNSSKSTSTKLTNDKGENLLFMMPCSGNVITAFSGNTLVYDKTFDDYRVHDGIDIAAKEGTPIMAVADGTVADIRQDFLHGQEVVIDHGNGLQSIYGNLTAKVTVKKAQKVGAGDVIGCVGSTAQGELALAPHIHLEMTRSGKYIDPLSLIGKK